MDIIFEEIKRTLDSDAQLLIENLDEQLMMGLDKARLKKKVVDHRFDLIRQLVDVEAITDNPDGFYGQLIEILAEYVDKLYDREVKSYQVQMIDDNEDPITISSISCTPGDEFNLTDANSTLAERLFNYVCSILSERKDIILSTETLKKLLNRSPRLFSLSVEESYTYRPFDFKKLVDILNENDTLRKSGIDISAIYGLLMESWQIDNDDVFGNIVSPEEFNHNHQSIDSLLLRCRARDFAAITRIIRNHFDSNFDRLHFIKQRNVNKFCEHFIIDLLLAYHDKEDIALIHEILTAEGIDIDYKCYYADHIGQSSLGEIMAFSGNRIVIRDLLNKEGNIRKVYRHGENRLWLHMLYATAGYYDKALETFQEDYHIEQDYSEDFDNDFVRRGYTYAEFDHEDSVAEFIKRIASSFKADNPDYVFMKDYIYRILSSDNVRYINLEQTLTPLVEIFTEQDFDELLHWLLARNESGSIKFIAATENRDESYTIKVVIGEEIEKCVAALNNSRKRILERIEKGEKR